MKRDMIVTATALSNQGSDILKLDFVTGPILLDNAMGLKVASSVAAGLVALSLF